MSDTGQESETVRAASSPYDQPTERVPTYSGATIPRTEDDFDPEPTQQLAATPAPAAPAASTYSYASIPPAPEAKRVEPAADTGRVRRGTLDLGLLILRFVVGGTFVFHGLQKLTGWWGGPGLDGVRDMMNNTGWKQPDIAAILVVAGELAGGTMVILGIATPLATGAVLAVIIDAWLVRQAAQPGLQYAAPNGPELETILLGATAALALTGPGRYAIDGRRGWATRPYVGSLLALLAAIAAAVCTWIFLHGGNPLA